MSAEQRSTQLQALVQGELDAKVRQYTRAQIIASESIRNQYAKGQQICEDGTWWECLIDAPESLEDFEPVNKQTDENTASISGINNYVKTGNLIQQNAQIGDSQWSDQGIASYIKIEESGTIDFLEGNFKSSVYGNTVYVKVYTKNTIPMHGDVPNDDFNLVHEESGTYGIDINVATRITFPDSVTVIKDQYLIVCLSTLSANTLVCKYNSTELPETLGNLLYYDQSVNYDTMYDQIWKVTSSPAFWNVSFGIGQQSALLNATDKEELQAAIDAVDVAKIDTVDWQKGKSLVSEMGVDQANNFYSGVSQYIQITKKITLSEISVLARSHSLASTSTFKIYKHNTLPITGDIPDTDYTLIHTEDRGMINAVFKETFEFTPTEFLEGEYIIVCWSTLTSTLGAGRRRVTDEEGRIFYSDSTDYANIFTTAWKSAESSAFGNVNPEIYIYQPKYIKESEIGNYSPTVSEWGDGSKVISPIGTEKNEATFAGAMQYTLVPYDALISRVSVYSRSLGTTGDVVFRIYTKSTAPIPGDIPNTSFNFIYEQTVSLTNVTSELFIDIPQTQVTAGHYVIVCSATKTSESVRLTKNPTDDLDGTAMYKTGTGSSAIFDQGWSKATTGIGFGNVPAGLHLSPPFLREVPSVNISNPTISLRPEIAAIVGDTLQVFFHSLIKGIPDGTWLTVSCAKGKNYPRYWEYTPAIGDVGTTPFNVKLLNNEGDELDSVTVDLVTKEAVSATAQTNVLCIGDSTMMGGTQVKEASRRISGTTGSGATTPAALALSNINFVGRVKNPDQTVGWEGIGGYTWLKYTSEGANAIRFDVSSITDLRIGSIYEIPRTVGTGSISGLENVWRFQIQEINVTAGSGYIKAGFYQTPYDSDFDSEPTTGTSTYVSGGGQATFIYTTRSLETYQPFWNNTTDQIDFTTYVDTYCGGQLDMAYIALGINDALGIETFGDLSGIIDNAKTFLRQLHIEYPAVQVIIQDMNFVSQNGGMGTSYAASSVGGRDREIGMNVKWHRLSEAYQSLCEEAEFSSYVKCVNASAAFDSEHAYPDAEKAVNVRSGITELVDTNGVHPKTEGYYYLGDILFRTILNGIE